MPPIAPDVAEQAVLLYGDGYTLREVGRMTGMHLETVRKLVKRAGVPVRSRQWRRTT
jgi:DNA-directed RNA polymerase specialized sigma24 family protein